MCMTATTTKKKVIETHFYPSCAHAKVAASFVRSTDKDGKKGDHQPPLV
jgi:hypothetical protein